MRCDQCSVMACLFGGKKPEFCPLERMPEAFKRAREIYKEDEETRNVTRNASIVELEGYMEWPRLKDTIEFARRMDYKKIGLAYCVGLQEEAHAVAGILEEYGFTPVSVMCKAGSIKKSELGVPDGDRLTSKTGYLIGYVSCDPVGQAIYLNEEETDMNVIVGLCVGHDMTFTRYSEAPVTTLIAKDRPTAHNPASVLSSSYWRTFFDMDRILPDLDEDTRERIRKRTEKNLDKIIKKTLDRLRKG